MKRKKNLENKRTVKKTRQLEHEYLFKFYDWILFTEQIGDNMLRFFRLENVFNILYMCKMINPLKSNKQIISFANEYVVLVDENDDKTYGSSED